MCADSAINIACILLAAGKSERFGSQKLLHPIGSGLPMLSASLLPYREVFDVVQVVVSKGNAEIKSLTEKHAAKLVEIDGNEGGISQSIVAGIQATADADGWLIGLADMPYLNSSTIRHIKDASHTNNIVIPRCEQRLGNPVAFGSEFREELLSLEGDKGAKIVTRRHTEKVVVIDTDDNGVLHDIDVPAAIRD